MVRRLADQELGLWRRVARTVRPLGAGELIRQPSSGETATEFEHLLAADRAPSKGEGPQNSQPQTPKRLAVSRPGKPSVIGGKSIAPPANMAGLKRVRRSCVDVTARLDLHGLTEDEAVRELATFVARQHALGCRCGLVITGKGRNGAGLLKRRFVDWLSAPDIRPAVSGYALAGPRHGGEGAYYLFFRSAR